MPEILPTTTYDAVALGVDGPLYAVSPLVQGRSLDAIDDDSIPRYYFTARYSPTSTYQPSNASPRSGIDEHDLPRVSWGDSSKPSPQPSATHWLPSPLPIPQPRVSRADSDFDSLYDVTEDEAGAPASVKKTMSVSQSRYPSLVIPSPSTWPTIEKLRAAMSASPQTPAKLPTPSREGLSLITSHNLRVPARGSAAPSLDGSLSSEDTDKLSCPSTPDTVPRESPLEEDALGPVQLDRQALDTLRHLGPTQLPSRSSSRTVSPARRASHAAESAEEMQQVTRPFLGLDISSSVLQPSSPGHTPVSALSVPSPGGFFASLHSTARHTWSIPKLDSATPNTSTAESFYQIPWQSRDSTGAAQATTPTSSMLDDLDDGLPTSRPVNLVNLEETLAIQEIHPSETLFRYNEHYHVALQKTGSANLERTGYWLEEQEELHAALRNMSDMASPTLIKETHSREDSIPKVGKKSVTFAKEPDKPSNTAEEPKKIATYIQGFSYLRDCASNRDVFVHRQTRAEALHVHRRCNPKSHQDQLLGKFELTNPVRPSPPRPVSEFYMDDPTALKERIARAQMERQALDQMLPITWVLQALKQLNGGRLLSKPARRCIRNARTPRILDVGGVATNDWAWAVALDYSKVAIVTVYTMGNNPTSNVCGPDNHKTMTVPNLWTLPFPSGHFDVISARTLHEFLKTDKPLGRSMDEYDLCVRECFRCLKPGGVFEFSILDSDIIHAGRQALAMGVEFGFNLKTRGYDAAPTKFFIPRLHKAGFRDLQRSWMILPLGKTAANWKDTLPETNEEERSIGPDGQVRITRAPVLGTTADAAMLTGIVGSWYWEKWLLRLQVEMGKEDVKLLEGVVQVLEEGAREGSGLRYLTGHARK